MSKRLGEVVGPDKDGSAEGEPTIGMPDLVADIHGMMTEQKEKADKEGAVGARLDALLAMMGEDKERQATQEGLVQQVLAMMDRQRSENETLLRALATGESSPPPADLDGSANDRSDDGDSR